MHESPWVMLFPLIILAIFSIIGGGLNLPHFIAHGEYQFLAQWLGKVLILPIKTPQISLLEEIILLISTLLMIGVVLLWSKKKYLEKDYQKEKIIGWKKLSQNKLYIDEIYQVLIVKPTEFLAKLLSFFDKKILDNNNDRIGNISTSLGFILGKIQNGRVETYLLLMSLAISILLILTKFL